MDPLPPPTELTLELPHLRLAARAWGPPHGARVLALHGWLDSAASFDRLAPLLPELRLVALDLAGHGESEHRHPSASYDFVNYIPDVVGAADALGWERFSLLGHSLGGAVAACVAGTVPGRVERLALLDGLGPLTTAPADAPAALGRALTQTRERPRQHRVYRDLQHAVDFLLLARGAIGEQAARVLAARGLKEVTGGMRWRHDPRLRGASSMRLTEPQVQAFLARIDCEVLVLRTARGWLNSSPELEQRLACLRQVRHELIAGGHHVHLSDPAPVARLVGEFLGRAAQRNKSPPG